MEWAVAGAIISALIGWVGWILTRDYREYRRLEGEKLNDFINAEKARQNEAKEYAAPRGSVNDIIDKL
jgi:hypothetical protein